MGNCLALFSFPQFFRSNVKVECLEYEKIVNKLYF